MATASETTDALCQVRPALRSKVLNVNIVAVPRPAVSYTTRR